MTVAARLVRTAVGMLSSLTRLFAWLAFIAVIRRAELTSMAQNKSKYCRISYM